MADQRQPDRAAWEGEMFRLLAENVLDYAIFVVDANRHVLCWSKGAERLLGFSEEEVLGKQCDCFFTPEDVRRGVPQKELEQALATGRGEDDRWHVRRDGSRFWASGAVTPLKDERGGLRGFAKIVRDHTEMKRAEEAAYQRERQLHLLTDHAPVLIAHCDAVRRYRFVNKPYAARFGLHPREVVGRRIRDVVGEAAYAAIEAHVDAALAGERVEFEAELFYEGPGRQVMRCAYDPELDAEGRVAGFVAAIVNVTEGRQAREALGESEGRLRALSDNLPHGAVYQVLGDRDGHRRFTYVSAGVERLFGVTPAEVLADANALYGLVHEEDRPRVAAAEEVALRDLAPFDCEFRLRARSGVVWAHCRSAPRRLPTGQTVWEGALLDVTDRKRSEIALEERARLAAFGAEVGVALTQADSLQGMLARCAEVVVRCLDAAFARIWTLDEAGGVLELQASAGLYVHTDGPHGRVPVGQFKIGLIAQDRQPLLTNDVADDPRIHDREWARREGMVAFAGYPLLVGERLVGVMAMFARQALSTATLEAMASVANGIALGIERQQAQERLHRQREWLRVTLSSIGDAVIATDTQGLVVFLNGVAASLTGWTQEEAGGRPLEAVFPVLNETTRQPVESPVAKALREGRPVGLANHTVLLGKDGGETPIADSAAPIRDERGRILGVVLVFRDVTDERRAGQALRASEARKAAVLETALDCIITIDSRGAVVEFNAAAERTFGYRREDVLGREMSELIVPPRMREGHHRGLAHYLATGEGPVLGRRLELPAMRADGGEFPAELAITRLPGDGPPLFTAYLRDVGDRKEAERRRNARLAVTQALAQAPTVSEALRHVLRSVCETLGWDAGSFWLLEREASVLRCVEAWYAPDAGLESFAAANRQQTFATGLGLPGRVWQACRPLWVEDVAREENFPRREVAAQAGLRGAFACPVLLEGEFLGAIEFFNRAIREPDADLLETMTTLAGQIGQFLERKGAEEALRSSEARLRSIIDNWPSAIFVKDRQGRYLLANKACEAYSGEPVERMIGKTDYDYLPGEVADRFRADDGRVLDSGAVLRYEEPAPLDGEARTSLTVKFPLCDSSGRPYAVCGIATDITDRKRAEERLREADRRKDEFLAMLAHELRNPLAPIRNAVQVIRLLGRPDPDVRRFAEMIERQVQTMTRLVDDLLDVSRITQGKIKLQKGPVELAAVVAQAVETARPLIEARRHELTVALPAEPVRLEADATRLAQVIGNLLTNAAKYTEEGGHVWLTAEREGSTAVVRVRDTGVGIPPELLGKVFDLFAQVDRSLARSEGGLGIGLTLVKSLVEMHGGRVEARSEGEGKGTELVVRLPIRQPPHAPDAANFERALDRPAPPRRVLVVDDNVDAAESLAMLLRVGRHDVRTAQDGATALQVAEAFRPEVVLLDLGLPRMDGFEVARRLREQEGVEKALLVALTGHGQEEDRRRSLEAGFDAHLVKPADPAALQRLLAGRGRSS